MTVVIEVLHYLLRQLIDLGESLSEDQSYENFKELILRHAVNRPPHSMAVLTLEDVKKIDLFVQDSFFKHFDMYKFCLTVKDELSLSHKQIFSHEQPQQVSISEGKEQNFMEFSELKEFFSAEEEERMRQEREYLLHGPGKIERILNEEMERLAEHMESKIT